MSKQYKAKIKRAQKKEVNKINWKLWLLAFASIVFFFAIYQTAMMLEWEFIVHIYAALEFGFLLTFGILNRGFSRFDPQSITFPEGYSEEQRAEVIEKEKKRRALAKRFLIPSVGILFAFAFDMINLVYIQPMIG